MSRKLSTLSLHSGETDRVVVLPGDVTIETFWHCATSANPDNREQHVAHFVVALVTRPTQYNTQLTFRVYLLGEDSEETIPSEWEHAERLYCEGKDLPTGTFEAAVLLVRFGHVPG